MQNKYQIGVYYFPNYHPDPRNEEVHGKGWTEWEIVKTALPRFTGHRQPLVPQWGYQDESSPAVMAGKIAAAADHGITNFIFDWYWYDQKPFLQRALENGFMNADNNSRLNFSLMWANHDCDMVWQRSYYEVKYKEEKRRTFSGFVNHQEFDKMTDYIVRTYFHHPAYQKINGCPYFSIYYLKNLIKGFGTVEQTKEALDGFRDKTKKAGFPDLHLNIVVSWMNVLGYEKMDGSMYDLVAQLGMDSATTYCWNPYIKDEANGRLFPATAYSLFEAEIEEHWNNTRKELKIPFHPNATMGWDPSPRAVQSDKFDNIGYPFMSICTHNTPEAFKHHLDNMKKFMDRNNIQFCTLNAWNEWTEGSYLEPDTVYGMKYLEAIRDVFL
jgi:hypothetical protein